MDVPLPHLDRPFDYLVPEALDADARPEAIESYISRLRKKLEGSGATITTMRGLGYLLSETP